MIVPVKIERITLNPEKRTYTVLLSSIEGLGSMSQEVSIREAQAIAGMSGNKIPEAFRTYSLLNDLVHRLGGRILSLKILKGKDDSLDINLDVTDANGKKMILECSFGDGIIVALNQKTPIMAEKKLLVSRRIRSMKKKLARETREDLEYRLNQAIDSENYELAAEIRDRLQEKSD